MNFLWAQQEQPKSWFAQYGWIFTGILAVIMIIIFVVMIVFIIKENQREKKAAQNLANDAFFYCFGGKENIVSLDAKGSRLIAVLKDNSQLKEEQLKALGITSLIIASDKVTLIIGEKSKEIADSFNQNK